MKKLMRRFNAPTPPLFRRLRNIGIALVTVGGSILTNPLSFSPVVIDVAGLVTLVGGTLAAISQGMVAKKEDDELGESE